MEPECGLALSARKVEYLKFILKTGGTVRTNEIASAFSVDPSTITKTLAEITAAGYISHVPYHGVCLTDFGKHPCGISRETSPHPQSYAGQEWPLPPGGLPGGCTV